MDRATMFEPQTVASDTTSLVSYLPVPGFGVLPVNAFVIKAREPVLVDTGLAALSTDFMKQLGSIIELQDLRWIWITHADVDHLGNLAEILRKAPQARIVTTYLGMAKMTLQGLPSDRMYLVNPGQQLDIGDRKLHAITPPTFDAPETTGLFDEKTSCLFSADSFGALLDSPALTAAEIAPQKLREGCLAWSRIDAPWLGVIDEAKYNRVLQHIGSFNADTILSAHLPTAKGLTTQLLGYLAEAPHAPAFAGPDQPALEAMMAA